MFARCAICLPHEDIFYIGDTARLPYGGKSKSTIERYSIEISGIAGRERQDDCRCLQYLLFVSYLKASGIVESPVVGVIAPGARAAVKETQIGHVGVIGTNRLSRAGLRANDPCLEFDVRVTSQACPLLVPLVEEAWLDEEITREVLHRYLDPVVEAGVDTLVFGCTHYPLLAPLIQEVCGPEYGWSIPRRTVRSP